ncbi:MAG: YbaB/EbfC family nucleoid-associated protein, partial [Chloroflexota bacterium]
MTVEATVGGGAVKVIATGHQKIVFIAVAKEAVNPEDVEMLQDLVLAAVNEALDKSRDLAAKHLGQLTGGMKIPGLM